MKLYIYMHGSLIREFCYYFNGGCFSYVHMSELSLCLATSKVPYKIHLIYVCGAGMFSKAV